METPINTPAPDSKDSLPVTFTESEIQSVFLGLMLAILLAALDQTTVSVALAKLAAELEGGELLGWVVSGYLISAAVATPIYGKLGDLYGRRVTLSSAIGLFLLGSVGCATAQSRRQRFFWRLSWRRSDTRPSRSFHCRCSAFLPWFSVASSCLSASCS